MKAWLLFPDQDSDWLWVIKAAAVHDARQSGRRSHEFEGFRPEKAFPWHADALRHDLGLEPLFAAMAGDAGDIRAVVEREVLNAATNDWPTIRYRQAMLRDALAHAQVVRDLLALAREAGAEQRRHSPSSVLGDHPDYVLRWGAEALGMALPMLRRLRTLADGVGQDFAAEGWQRFFAMIRSEVDDAYLATVERQLGELRMRDGMRLSAGIGDGSHATGYRLHEPPIHHYGWWERLLRRWFPSFYQPDDPFGFTISPRDEAAARSLREFSNRGIAVVAQAVGDAARHLCDFFDMLRAETAFYAGAIALHEQMAAKGLVTAFPDLSPEASTLHAAGLYDPILALGSSSSVIGNDLEADDRSLIVVTGANQGGKSTFLRAVGLAQLMGQAGLFVGATAFAANPVPAVMTHFKREEDTTMASGKFDEELVRMSAIVDHFAPGALLLLNESFAATAEREAAEIADELITSLREHGAKVVFVTHLFEYAGRVAGRQDPQALFLRADRAADGSRPFRILPGEPLSTSFGQDLYREVFADHARHKDAPDAAPV